MKPRLVVISLVLIGASSLLYAHDLFIKLDSYFVAPHTDVRIPVLNGTIDSSANSISRDRVPDISVVTPQGRERIDTTAWLAEGDTTFLSLTTDDAGTYVVGASTYPRELDLTGAEFNEYLEHDGIPDVLEQRRQRGELETDVRERYSKHVKAVFQVGDRLAKPKRRWQFWRPEPTYLTALGYPAEIIPLINPYRMSVGAELQVQCLVDELPVANQLVRVGGLGSDGAFDERRVRTDEQGVAVLTIDAPGIWFVEFITMVPVQQDSIDYESKWATLTFQIR
jgi:hypothetical protein